VRYVASDDQKERNELFNKHINYALHKLAENIIHTFKFYYTEVETIEELKHEVVCVLLEKLHKYRQSEGKAYSYFGTIVKRYLIVYNNNNYKKLKNKGTIEEVDVDKTITSELIKKEDIDVKILDFTDAFVELVDTSLFKLFTKHKEATVADAVLELFKKRERLDVMSKKALYIYIREITEAPTPVITKVIKKLKGLYEHCYGKYLETGILP
jgi:hypothetical protein